MPMPWVPRILNKRYPRLFDKFVLWLSESRSEKLLNKTKKYISGKKILDIGPGVGSVAYLLQQKKGYKVTCVDIKNLIMYQNLQLIIYDGKKLPFKNKCFDTGLLFYVLHHTQNWQELIAEALRVCQRVIIMEDTYRNWLEYKIVSGMDSFFNHEFYQHKYLTEKEWRDYLLTNRYKLKEIYQCSDIDYLVVYGRHLLMVVER